MNRFHSSFVFVAVSAVVASPIAHADSDGVFLGISAARLQAQFGPFSQESASGNEARRTAFDEAASSIAIEFSAPIARRFSVDVLFVPGATATHNEMWPVFDANGPILPSTSRAIVIDTEIRALGFAGAVRAHPAPNLTLFGKAGGLWVERTAELTPQIPGTGFRQIVRDRDVVPWVAVGARYVVFRGLTVTAEIGGGTDHVRTASIGIGWTL